jgi:RHS repeat-associated protein
LANSQGSVTAQYAYDSYGVMLGQTSGAQQRQATSLLYSGEQFDSTLQQYHLRARNYNQANGQFTTLDPYAGNIYDPQSLHKYAYCHTDPVNAVDPSGESYTLNDVMCDIGLQASILAISAPNWVKVLCWVGSNLLAVINMCLIVFDAEYRMWLASLGPEATSAIIAGSIIQIGRLFRLCHQALVLSLTNAPPKRVGLTSLWGGGSIPKEMAEASALAHNGKTLTMTQEGAAVEAAVDGVPWPIAKLLWRQASRRFVMAAAGEIEVFVGQGINYETSILMTDELGECAANQEVTEILIHLL